MALFLRRNRVNDPAEKSIVWDLRIRLGDNEPDRYLFDDPVYKWLDEELLLFYFDALQYVNTATPITGWTLTSNQLDTHTRDGAFILALEQMMVRQAGEKFSFSDYGFSLTFDKYAAYQAALGATGGRGAWIAMVREFKKAFRPRSIGLGSQQLPFNIMRPLGMVPSLRTVFNI